MRLLKKVILIYLMFSSVLFADIINVPADQSTIQAGINAAVNGDTVLVSDGLYYENIDFKGKAITVASLFLIDGNASHIDSTIIDGSQHSNPDSGSVVYFGSDEDTTSILCGFTITGGSGTYDPAVNGYGGGGIYIFGSGSSGGKIIHNKIIKNNILSNSKLCGGAGIMVFFAMPNRNLVVKHNEIKNNSLTSSVMAPGGGIYIKWVTPSGYTRIRDNVITGNSATCLDSYKAIAGGIGLSMDLPTAVDAIVENNTITNNELHCVAGMGAGIYVVYWDPGYIITDSIPSPIIRNNIIANNYSEDLGGGIGIWTVESAPIWPRPGSIIKPQPAIINNTIVNNVAQDGCGIFNFDSYPLLLNNIFWDDLSSPGSREIFNDNITYPGYLDHINDGEVFAFYSDIQDTIWPGTGNLNIDPLFVNGDSLYNLEHSTDTSRCLNSGIDSIVIDGKWYYSPSNDFMGNSRPLPIGTPPDMGAWEYDVVNSLENIQRFPIPKTVILNQNYPNPFNPTTTIEFSISKTEFVSLKIYNLLGQEMVTLVSEKLSPGKYKYDWDASGFGSGVYLYKLESNSFVQTRKLIFLK